MHFESKNEDETAAFAEDIAKACIKHCQSAPLTITLQGNLGAGKTALARAIIRHITGHADMHVPSPTFTLVQNYEGPQFPIWHCDFYRLEDPEEVFELGWDDMRSSGLLLIEWPEKLGPYEPNDCAQIFINIGHDDHKTRIIEIQGLDIG